MPIKDFQVGAPPTAANINRYFQQRAHVVRSTNKSITSTTTAQNDDQLFLQVQANTDYWLEAFLIYDGATGGDIKIGWSVPSGATLEWTSNGLTDGATSTADDLWRRRRSAAQDEICGALGAGTNAVAMPEGLLRVASTAGPLRLRWAQGASSATSTIVKSGSLLMVSRMVP
ncbi:hypothetical protein [Sphaerisporangium sp. TRM90804]|uniref:hypothetical protein n=1 Tax=Sphaerisporangium sp. TRM90804 TaxID=3031113 RepID=UPI002446A691|nr:hypothetical protein [Sphaerisporangium sp. TRM90804]MDH2429310.1 hypothetical protein [Sphaerisporangium sp. TRM90804]